MAVCTATVKLCTPVLLSLFVHVCCCSPVRRAPEGQGHACVLPASSGSSPGAPASDQAAYAAVLCPCRPACHLHAWQTVILHQTASPHCRDSALSGVGLGARLLYPAVTDCWEPVADFVGLANRWRVSCCIYGILVLLILITLHSSWSGVLVPPGGGTAASSFKPVSNGCYVCRGACSTPRRLEVAHFARFVTPAQQNKGAMAPNKRGKRDLAGRGYIICCRPVQPSIDKSANWSAITNGQCQIVGM